VASSARPDGSPHIGTAVVLSLVSAVVGVFVVLCVTNPSPALAVVLVPLAVGLAGALASATGRGEGESQPPT
jgi:hypothetical protein